MQKTQFTKEIEALLEERKNTDPANSQDIKAINERILELYSPILNYELKKYEEFVETLGVDMDVVHNGVVFGAYKFIETATDYSPTKMRQIYGFVVGQQVYGVLAQELSTSLKKMEKLYNSFKAATGSQKEELIAKIQNNFPMSIENLPQSNYCELVEDVPETWIQNLYTQDAMDQIYSAVEQSKFFNPKTKLILQLYFGFDDNKPKSMNEISKLIGLSRERTRKILVDSMRRLTNCKAYIMIRPDCDRQGRNPI